jgi:hypothetical protein
MGNKISYSDNGQKDFIPTNLRLGTALTMNFDNYNNLTYILDINKLLVPTPPEYGLDENGNPVTDKVTGKPVIYRGYSNDVSVPQGMLQSFYDAPGGFKEEMQEIMVSLGLEYWYANQFALRAGYFNESQNKGNRKFFTLGAGLRMNVFNIDFSYLVPSSGMNNPLANTVRISLGFNFNRQKVQKKPAV